MVLLSRRSGPVAVFLLRKRGLALRVLCETETPMQDLVRWTLAITLVMLVPIIPFLGFGDALESHIEHWFDANLSPTATGAAVVAVLAADVLLPVPSSAISTLAGARLGPLAGGFVVWLGMTLGAMIGFALARTLGRPLAQRLASADDLRRMELIGEERGTFVLALTRPLPILAEASVLLLGALGVPWRRFLPVVMLANLGLAAAYAVLGYFAGQEGNLAVALAASIALPLLATMIARYWLPTVRETA